MKIAFKETRMIALEKINDFQGELKRLPKENYEKLYALIKKKFTMPFNVWESKEGKIYTLDGKQRKRILMDMRANGEKIPKRYPCNFIEAESEKEAKEILLTFVSQYGKINPPALYEYMIDNELEPDFLKDSCDIPDLDMDQFFKDYFDIKTTEPPLLNEEDKNPYQQMTFTVHDTQAEKIKTAIEKARQKGAMVSEINQNQNGNAITFICEYFINNE